MQSSFMVCHHQCNKDTANRRGLKASHQTHGGPAAWLTAGKTCRAQNKESNISYTLIHPTKHRFSQAVSTCENKNLNTGYSCKRRGLAAKRRGFIKCSLDLIRDILTAGLLTVYTEGKQLGIGVSSLWANRCSPNHAGTANKYLLPEGPGLHPLTRKGFWTQTKRRGQTPHTIRATVLPILWSLDPQWLDWPLSCWGANHLIVKKSAEAR